MNRIDSTDLRVFPLCLGCNVFGWTVDETVANQILDAFVAGGGNFIDTADQYAAWVPGNSGGESEEMIGRWMARRGNRDSLILATKVGKHPGQQGLRPDTIRHAAESSLRRLGIDHIDLYYAHQDDPSVPIEETLGAFTDLVDQGKVRHIAASNFTAPRLAAAFAASASLGLARFVALQPPYNLVQRAEYEGALRDLCQAEGVSCLPYYALANGFLTGKYRTGSAAERTSERANSALAHLDTRGKTVLAALDQIAEEHQSSVATVAIAWLAAQPTVAAPIASARTTEQLEQLLAAAQLELSAAERTQLTAASETSSN